MYTHIATTSAIFQSRLAKLKDTFPQFIEEVRGRGLILGIQLKSVGDKTPSDVGNLVLKSAREKGLLLITAGEGALRLVPPLNIPEEAVVEGLSILEEAMRDISREI
jgi:acetylornithine aminotransferase